MHSPHVPKLQAMSHLFRLVCNGTWIYGHLFLFHSLCDHLRKFSVSPFFTHMSFCCSLVCAYLALVVGLVEALPNTVSGRCNLLFKIILVSF
jgi:hypothetical protein